MLKRFPALPGALAAIVALSLSAAAPPVLAAELAGSTATNTKEALPPNQRAEKKKIIQAEKKKSGQPWQWDKRGNALDGCGDFHSAKRIRRQILIRLAGVPDTGRQWVRLRKMLRHEAPFLLTAHPRHLAILEANARSHSGIHAKANTRARAA